MAGSGSLPTSLEDQAKRHLGISNRGTVAPHYLAELRRFSLEYPDDLNFRIAVDDNYGVVHCLERGCEKESCALGPNQDAPLGGKGTVGSLRRYCLHICVHPTHIQAGLNSPEVIDLCYSNDEQDQGPLRKKTKIEVAHPKTPHTTPGPTLNTNQPLLPTRDSNEAPYSNSKHATPTKFLFSSGGRLATTPFTGKNHPEPAVPLNPQASKLVEIIDLDTTPDSPPIMRSRLAQIDTNSPKNRARPQIASVPAAAAPVPVDASTLSIANSSASSLSLAPSASSSSTATSVEAQRKKKRKQQIRKLLKGDYTRLRPAVPRAGWRIHHSGEHDAE